MGSEQPHPREGARRHDVKTIYASVSADVNPDRSAGLRNLLPP
jgi:hypothetical protein